MNAPAHTDDLPGQFENPADGIAEFEQILLSNSGEDAFETAIGLLFAKLVDEIEVAQGAPERFRIHATAEATHRHLNGLFAQACLRWPSIGNGSGELANIPAPQLVRTLRPLLGWRLRGSDLTWLDATLERLVARDAKGALGQYFTPRDVIRLCVEALAPAPGELVIDPACGSGGFLFEAVRHAMRTTGDAPQCLGIDFSARSLRVATLLAAALDEKVISISKGNSLDGRQYVHSYPPEWRPFLRQKSASTTPRAQSWGAWNRLGCDVLFANPPFAGDIDEMDLLDAYESLQDLQSRKSISREQLFLERAVDLLGPGGRLAIVLPQGILANSSSHYLRRWLLERCRVLGVIGLHPHAFLPYTGVKTSVLFLSKPRSSERPAEDYPIYFAISSRPGKDSSGRPAGPSDYDELSASFAAFLSQQGFAWRPPLTHNEHSVECEIVPACEVMDTSRLDAEHYDPHARALERRLRKQGSLSISHVVEASIPRFRKQHFQEIAYVDIGSVDNRTGLAVPSITPASEAPGRATFLVAKGDVLVSTVRPERNIVALVTSENDHPLVASNGFCVLRSEKIPSELLFAYCKTESFRRMLTMHATASMYPTVSDRDILSLPFVPPTSEVTEEVVGLIRSGLQKIEEANQQIERAIATLESFVNGTSETSGD